MTNSVASIRARTAAGQVGWTWPLVMAFIRLPLIVLGIGVAFAVYVVSGAPEPFLAALLTASLITVLVNVVSLALLRWLTRREGIRLRDLIGFDRSRLGPDLAWGLALLVLLNVPFILTLMLTATLLGGVATGEDFATAMDSVFVGPLADPSLSIGVPVWVAITTAVLFPLINPIVEEMNYRGYVQPRLQALSGSGRVAIGIMAAGFALQHVTYALSVPGIFVYAAAFFVWGIAAGIVYSRMRRLTSLIAAHFVINASTAVIPVVFLLVPATG